MRLATSRASSLSDRSLSQQFGSKLPLLAFAYRTKHKASFQQEALRKGSHMTVNGLKNIPEFSIINEGDMDKEITVPFCCDLLSVAMSKAPAGAAWVTIMGNVNALAVSSLTDCACIILAEGTAIEPNVLSKAKIQEITLFKTDLPIFDAALKVYNLING